MLPRNPIPIFKTSIRRENDVDTDGSTDSQRGRPCLLQVRSQQPPLKSQQPATDTIDHQSKGTYPKDKPFVSAIAQVLIYEVFVRGRLNSSSLQAILS